MDVALQKVQDLLAKWPENSSIREAYTKLLEFQTSPTRDINLAWDAVQRFVDVLQAQGLWEESAENNALLDQIRAELAVAVSKPAPPASGINVPNSSWLSQGPVSGSAETISIVSLPPTASPPLRTLGMTTLLPIELAEVLNQTYFLHILATDPRQVLPPGKSLLSVMTSSGASHGDSDTPTLESRVEDLVHKAFWDEVLESLLSQIPSIQIPRLKRLYEDLHIVLVPLLPSGHPVLVTLSSPLSPTSAPLRTALTHLREVLDSLKQRCAPIRDSTITALLQRIEDPPTVDLPRIVVETIRDTLKFAEAMKEDLSQFVLGSMGETQLRGVIRAQAQDREHGLVIELWGVERILSIWKSWLSTLDVTTSLGQLPAPQDRKWILRLVQALGSNSAVSCSVPVPSSQSDSPSPSPNQLPPPFFMVAPTLLKIQNYLQALVITATLRSLVRLPPPAPVSPSSPAPETPSPAEDFMQRIWTLLSDEIDHESGETKLVNLADEIIRVRGLVGGAIDEDEEKKLRAAVDRTLQLSDPVFQLLQKRLLRAIAERLLSATPSDGDAQSSGTAIVPSHLQSGRGPRSSKKPEFKIGLPGVEGRSARPKQPDAAPAIAVKGFDDAVLSAAVNIELARLRGCIEWLEEVWREVVSGNS